MRRSCGVQLALEIIKEAFGDLVTEVCMCLLIKKVAPLRIIRSECKLTMMQTKKALSCCIQHNLVTADLHKRGFYEYTISLEAILARLYYPSFIYCARLMFEEIAEVIVEEILRNGKIKTEILIENSVARLNANLSGGDTVTASKITSVLDQLQQTTFITLTDTSEDKTAERESSPPPTKKVKLDTEPTSRSADPIKYYSCNTWRFLMYLRDQQMIETIKLKLDQAEGEILRAMLRISEVKTNPQSPDSYPIASNEVFTCLPKHVGVQNRNNLDLYMNSLSECSLGFIKKAGDAGGGQHQINYKAAMESLVLANVESMIQERFGSKSLRIFKIVLSKQHLEQKQIEDLALVPAKHCKELLYEMYSHGLITTSELSKTIDHAPSRTFYCFRVNVEEVARKQINYLHKAILNVRTKRTAINLESRRVVDRQQKVKAILAQLESSADDQQKQEIEDMITPAEKKQLDQLNQQNYRLDSSEQQLLDTLLIFNLYIEYVKITRIH